MNKPFSVGDKVFDIRRGNGIVFKVHDSYLQVNFNYTSCLSYTKDGFYTAGLERSSDKFPSLYHGHDLIITVKEPEYEWQVLYTYPQKDGYKLSSHFYSSVDNYLKRFPYPELIINPSLFEPSKRIRSI